MTTDDLAARPSAVCVSLTPAELSTLHAEATARGTTTEALALKWLREKLGQSHAETSTTDEESTHHV